MSVFGIPGFSPLPAYGISRTLPMSPYGANAYGIGPALAQPGSRYGLEPARTGARLIGESPVSNNRFVRAVKLALRELGLYHGKVTSAYDTQTRRGVAAFQRRSGLRATGQANVGTRRALRRAVLNQATGQRALVGIAPDGSRITHVARGTRRSGAPVAAGTLGMAGAGGLISPYGAQMPGAGAPASPFAMGTLPFHGPGMTLPPTGLPQAPDGPQVNASNQQGIANGTTGATQNVTNRNVFDSGLDSRYRGPSGYGFGYGMGMPFTGATMGWNSTPGVLPPMPSPYGAPGASMLGAGYLGYPGDGGGISGFFRSLFGA